MIEQFTETIRAAAAEGRKLRIRGGGTKDFFGVTLDGEVLDTRGHSGIVDYEPSELVLTARAGTPLAEVEAALAEGNQMLAFEPPHFAQGATIGGAIAAGFSGPRRAAAGSARDFVLGARVLDSLGRELAFGGRVMKNVAGYDLSRFLAGSCGTLALLTEISLKVLPRPETELTLAFTMDEVAAIEAMNRWAGQPLPISATFHHGDRLTVRLSGAAAAVAAARAKMGGEDFEDGAAFWPRVRDHVHPFFTHARALWRLSIKSTTPPLELGPQAMEWNGALRWIATDLTADTVHAAAQRAGGHATLFRGGDRSQGIQRLAPAIVSLQQRLKHSLDPNGIFGPRRLHPDL